MSNLSPGITGSGLDDRILCVDDDPEVLNARKLLLEASGYRVVAASSGSNALEILANDGVIRLVVVDYLMPEMDGSELASKLRARYPNLPLLVVSGIADLPQRLLENANAHLSKGADPEVLLSTISELMKSDLAPPSPRPRQTVLCVEDEELQLTLRRLLFEGAGYAVLEASSTSSAMELFRSHELDAVVMDYSLSGRNGASLASEMKQLRPGVPILMLSGFSPSPEDEAAVDCWCRKVDVEPEDLIKKVQKLISQTNSSRSTSE